MNIRINNKAHPKTLLIATKRYIEKMIQELSLVSKRKNKFKDDIPQDFIKRESTTIIANNIHAIQSLYQWEKNKLAWIIYMEECYYNSKTQKEKKVDSTIEHVIPIAHFKEVIFLFLNNWNIETKEAEKEIIKAFLSPVALIQKEHINSNNPQKVKDVKKNQNPYLPFKRYNDSWINIMTFEGNLIDKDSWSLQDHRKLMKKKNDFNEIIEEFNIT